MIFLYVWSRTKSHFCVSEREFLEFFIAFVTFRVVMLEYHILCLIFMYVWSRSDLLACRREHFWNHFHRICNVFCCHAGISHVVFDFLVWFVIQLHFFVCRFVCIVMDCHYTLARAHTHIHTPRTHTHSHTHTRTHTHTYTNTRTHTHTHTNTHTHTQMQVNRRDLRWKIRRVC